MPSPDTIAKAKGGAFKASVGAVFFELCQHITPPLAGYLNAKYPILGADLSFEIVVLIESAVSWVAIKTTPQHISDAIVEGILWGRAQLRRWRDALNGKDDV